MYKLTYHINKKKKKNLLCGEVKGSRTRRHLWDRKGVATPQHPALPLWTLWAGHITCLTTVFKTQRGRSLLVHGRRRLPLHRDRFLWFKHFLGCGLIWSVWVLSGWGIVDSYWRDAGPPWDSTQHWRKIKSHTYTSVVINYLPDVIINFKVKNSSKQWITTVNYNEDGLQSLLI